MRQAGDGWPDSASSFSWESSCAGCGQDDKQPALEVTYIANEGFMVSMGSTTILIDALPKSKYYANPSDTLTARIMNGIPV